MSRITVAGFVTVCLLIAGCRGNKEPALVPVSGTVRYQGKPLTEAEIMFIPVETTPGRGAKGRTDTAGKYKLWYLRGGEGAPPGQYKITLSKTYPPAPEFNPNEPVQPVPIPGKETLPLRLVDHNQTKITVTVPKEGSSKLDIDVK